MKRKTCPPKILIIVILLAGHVACAGDLIQQSADDYCALYNPEHWDDSVKNTNLQEIYGSIVTKQEKLALVPKIETAIKNADTSSYAAYYRSVKSNIETVLIKSWECKYFQDFYLPKQKVVTLKIGKTEELQIDPSSADVLTVVLAHDGTVLIDNAPLKSSNTKTIQAAIKSHTSNNSSKFNVVVYFNEGSDAGKAAGLLRALSEAGIKQVRLIDY